ncbi:MAG: S8 family serine peptidase, partial [Cyanobacteria bacterium P01_E01_bin.42]
MRGNWVQRLLTATKNANAMELPFPGEDIAIAGKTEKVSFDKFFRDKTKESSSRVREIELLSLDTNNSTTSDRKTHKTLSGKNSFENDLKIHFNRDSSNIKTTGDRSQPIIPKPERDLHIDRPGKVKSESPKEALEEPFSSGVFVVGESGEVGFDFLFDGGKHKSELAIFSLEGMEDIEFGSTTFIREATSRALDRSSLGHVVIRDRTEGAKFDGKLEGKNWNKGEHKGVKMFQMNPGDRFGIMLIPNGTVKQIHKNPNSKGAKKPLFSLATEGNDFGQIADINGKGHTFAMEDVQPEHKGFDRDYNDIIFQVSGATAQTQSLDNAIDPQKDWRGTDVGQEIVQYIEENDPNRPNLPIDPGTGSPYKPGELLIKFAANTSNAEIQKLANDYGAIAFENLVPFDPDSDSPLQQWRLFRFDPNSDLLPIREAISEENGIESLEFNAVRYLSWTPNDPDYEYLWGLNNKNRPDVDINVEQAWDIQRGSKNINVAVIDTGIDYNHLDLHENMWRNLGEIAGNGIDDDGNGYIDDIYGYDFGNGDSDPIPDRFAWYDFEFGHGTHVAGTVGAVGDNDKGIIGVSPNVSLMALNIRDTLASLHESKSVLTLDAIAKSINYAVNNGADIINASFEGPNHFSLEYDAIQYANNKGVVVVAAAGNQSKNNDIHGVYPANYSQNFSNVISVAATNDRDELWGNSNYGALSVDLGAPGEGIYSTMPGNLYDGSSGTSMAAPHVAGAAALLLAENPSLTPEEIKNILLDTGDSLAALQGKTVSGKRLNLYKALKAVVQAEETSVYKIGNEFQINTETEKGQWGASVAALDDGGFVVTWTSWEQDGVQGGIYGQRYDRNGNKVKGEFQINTTTFQMQTGANIKTLNDGTFVVTWHSFEQDGSDEAIIGRRYDAEGNALTDEFQINTRSQFDQEWPDIAALVDGGFVVVWHADEDGNNGYAAYGQRYNSAGEKVGDEFRANTHNENEQIVPRVAVLNDGGFVVAWWSKQQDSNGDGVYAQRYGSDGELLGEEFRVNTEILYNERDPAIVALNDGGFFIAWVSNYGNNGIFNGVRGQRYDANGDAVGDELQLSDASTGQYTRWPKLTSLQDGGFVATWESWSDGEVYGRRFSANGTAIGEQFRVNDYTDGAQNGGEMATLKDGNFVVTWASEGQDGDDMGVYGRIFEVTDAIAPTIVTNTNDSGEGSLRAALEWANANLGRDTITFDIPITDPGYNATTGTFTIQPLTALPEIKDPAILNATTQDQFTNTPIVELDGSLAGNSQGFRMVTSDSKIQGFVINHFEIGLTLYGNNNKIQGNFIGTDVTGTKILGNSIDGIRILGSNNWIGGIIEGSENLISGNQHGVKIQSNDNIIQGNLIGTDITGTKILGNDYNGITIEQGTNNLIGGTIERSENLISGNQNGVKIQSNDNIIQ